MRDKLYNFDQIYKPYRRGLGGTTMLSTRERFDWQASMVKGEKILFIGCSTSILGVLLAREGKRVYGIDASKEIIRFAEELKNGENEVVKGNLTFKVGDYMNLNIKKKFDTIILGEVLEHLYYPKKFLEKVRGNLNKGGRVIVTVPFGINDYYGQKKNYYLYNLLEIFRDNFTVVNVKFGVIREYSNWVGIVAELNSSSKARNIYFPFLEELEKSFYQRERFLLSRIKHLSLENNNIRSQNSQFVNMSGSLEELKAEREVLQLRAEQYNNEIYSLRESINNYENRKIIKAINFAKKLTRIPSILITKFMNIYEKSCMRSKVKKLTRIATKIQASNGSSMYDAYDVNIAIITDEFMFNYYSGSVKNLFYVNYDNYKEVITRETDIVLFISCWYGMEDNDWQGIGNNDETALKNLFEIFEYARRMGAEIVFQTIEDPSNYEIFLPIAEKSDYIFTTDADKIEDYKIDTGNEKVYFLEYGVNPRIHNPIGCNYVNDSSINKLNKVFFAGSWTRRYKDRCKDASMLFTGVISSNKNLLIADRNYLRTEESLKYPEKFRKYVIPGFPHLVLQNVHKLFDWNINLNSIKYSSTMCAMRVYELQALGTLILSNYSKSVVARFPNIFVTNDSSQVKDIIQSYSQKEKYKMKVDGIRNVLSHCTVYDRLGEIFEKTHLSANIKKKDKLVVLYDGKNKKIRQMFEAQTYVNKNLYDQKDFSKEISNEYDYVTFFSDDYEYGPYYLEDMMNCFKFVNVPYVTKGACYNENGTLIGTSHNYIDNYKSRFNTIFNLHLVKLEDILNDSIVIGKGYSSDPFGFKKKEKKVKSQEKDLSVIIPVGDNGKQLQGRTLLSLLRSVEFKKMKIILLKDYTEEQTTTDIINEIENSYSNIIVCDRTEALQEVKKTEYFTFVHPGNEVSKNIYLEMMTEVPKNGDFIFGYTQLYRGKPLTIKNLGRYNESGFIQNPVEFLLEMKFDLPTPQVGLFRTATFAEYLFILLDELLFPSEASIYKILLGKYKSYYFDKPVLTQYQLEENYGKNYWEKEYKYHKNIRATLKKHKLLTKFCDRITPILIRDIYWFSVSNGGLCRTDYLSGIKKILSSYNYQLEEKYLEELKKIPNSNGHEYYEKFKYKVAVITDQLAYDYLEGVADFEYVNTKNYKKVFEKDSIDMLLFVTCWYGMDKGDLVGHIENPHIKKGVFEIFEYSKERDIPIVFWSKEDPLHYNSFLDYAKKADYIFTTAEECIEKYKEDTLNPNVFLLTYGINPLTHNPIGFRQKYANKYKTLNKVLFAGTWYPNHQERMKDQTFLFDGVISSQYELLVLDRNFFNTFINYPYPRKYAKFVYPGMEYNILQKAHKLFDWALNLNTIKESNTMCAARVYELQALGISIISNSSPAVSQNFPNIYISKSMSETTEILNKANPMDLYKVQVEGIRKVYSGHTVFDRFAQILFRTGFVNHTPTEVPIVVFCNAKTKKIVEMFSNQLYKNKTLLELTELKKLESNAYITFFKEDYIYGENYLIDMINAFKYTDVAYVTKDSYFDGDGRKKEGVEHDYIQKVEDKYRTLFSTKKLDINAVLSDKPIIELGYSIDPFELSRK